MIHDRRNLPDCIEEIHEIHETKSVTLAERIGYDVSYISKWINGAKLPSSRAIERVNEDAAALFAETIENSIAAKIVAAIFFSRHDRRPDLRYQRLSKPGLPHVAPKRTN